MEAAREVGGDFYDFFFIDDDHLALIMADVSGKGVPAALFMMITKIILKNRAMQGGGPGEILSDVNRQICDGNGQNMFVTTWLAILNVYTGEMVTASAGHEYPAICRADGSFEFQKDRHGFVLGGMDTVDLIASVPTNASDKPMSDQTMRTVYVETYGQTYSFTKLED